MKKIIAALAILVLSTGVSFASFQVEKSQKAISSSSISDSRVVSAERTVKMEAKDSDVSYVSNESAGSGKNGTIAIILALISVIFLPFGLHNWYLGRTKQALWQTLMVFPGIILLGLPALASWIWQIVDLIRLLINGGTL